MKTMKSKKAVWAAGIFGALLISAATVFAFSLGKYESVKVGNGVVALPIAKLADGKAHFYKIEDSGKEIVFFAAKSADGSYKVAFDACDACFKSRKGYEQQGDKMNCKNCNQKFAINRLGPNATGGCNPGYLPSQINGNNIVIKVADIQNGARYF